MDPVIDMRKYSPDLMDSNIIAGVENHTFYKYFHVWIQL